MLERKEIIQMKNNCLKKVSNNSNNNIVLVNIKIKKWKLNLLLKIKKNVKIKINYNFKTLESFENEILTLKIKGIASR